ncbi:c-type cytochrome [Bartonella sp. B30(2025)]
MKKRLIVACFACVCLFLLIMWMVIPKMSNRVYHNSEAMQLPHKVTENNALKENQQISVSFLSLNDRLQQGDFENGRKIFRRCAVCHTSSKDKGLRRVGPSLWEIVNRPLANTADFAYSRALRANSDKIWDFMTLDHYLQSPRKAFPGTIMSFRGIENDQDRADLLLYLRSLSDHPASLPVENKENVLD